MIIGDLFFFPPIPYHNFSDPLGSRCRLLFSILKARWLQLPTVSIINELSSLDVGLEGFHRKVQ